jgi:hypothetical protein
MIQNLLKMQVNNIFMIMGKIMGAPVGLWGINGLELVN